MNEREAEIVGLPGAADRPSEPPPSPPGRLHGWAIAGMAGAALTGIAIMFLFITVSWPSSVDRMLMGGLFLCAIAFLASASTAVLTAARDAYATPRDPD